MQYFPEMREHLDKLNASASMNCMKWFLGIFIGIFPTEVFLRMFTFTNTYLDNTQNLGLPLYSR